MELCAVCQRGNKATSQSAASTAKGITVPFYPGHKGEKSFPCSRFYNHPNGNLKYHVEFLTGVHKILNFSVQNYTYNTALAMFYITNTERSVLYGNLSSVIKVLVTVPSF
jgi:hypothetical protein